MQLTDHFSSEEFAQPARHGFERIEYPEAWLEARLKPLCQQLERIRSIIGGRPMRVLSGYRSEAYNRAIGGAKHSQHLRGMAADITAEGMTARGLHSTILKLYAAGVIKIGGLGLYAGFVHVDLRDADRLVRWRGLRTAAQTVGA